MQAPNKISTGPSIVVERYALIGSSRQQLNVQIDSVKLGPGPVFSMASLAALWHDEFRISVGQTVSLPWNPKEVDLLLIRSVGARNPSEREAVQLAGRSCPTRAFWLFRDCRVNGVYRVKRKVSGYGASATSPNGGDGQHVAEVSWLGTRDQTVDQAGNMRAAAYATTGWAQRREGTGLEQAVVLSLGGKVRLGCNFRSTAYPKCACCLTPLLHISPGARICTSAHVETTASAHDRRVMPAGIIRGTELYSNRRV